jgi:hypothetical protein
LLILILHVFAHQEVGGVVLLIRGTSVNTLADNLKPGFISSVFNDVPKLVFWDFAGQLE